VGEKADEPCQSIHGRGCRPTRGWVHAQLRRHFERVYYPLTQPADWEYPLRWDLEKTAAPVQRAIFIASRHRLHNPMLTETMPVQQFRR
jgi:hypothetical protein